MRLLSAIALAFTVFVSAAVAAEPRHTLFALGGNQATPGKEPYFSWTVDGAILARNADAITITVEDYGIPWTEFAAAAEPPPDHVWTRTMLAFAKNMQASEKPLILQMVLTRDKLAKRAMVDETLKGDNDWQDACYNFKKDKAQVATAFANYAKWMVKTFKPAHVVSGVEITEYLRVCGTKHWPRVVKVLNTTYDAIKATQPDVLVYPSSTLNVLYGDQVNGFDQNTYELVSQLKRDRFGISTYPLAFKSGKAEVRSAAQLPDDFLVRPQKLNPNEMPVVVTETGWQSVSMAFGTPDSCNKQGVVTSPKSEADYITWLGRNAEQNNIGLVVWWSAYDLMPAHVPATCYPKFKWFSTKPCKGDMHCLAINVFRNAFGGDGILGEFIYKIFATMGIYDYAGKPKPLVTDAWKVLRARPYAP